MVLLNLLDFSIVFAVEKSHLFFFYNQGSITKLTSMIKLSLINKPLHVLPLRQEKYLILNHVPFFSFKEKGTHFEAVFGSIIPQSAHLA